MRIAIMGSSIVQSVEYDEAHDRLDVGLPAVPAEIYRAFMNAESKGHCYRHCNDQIRDICSYERLG